MTENVRNILRNNKKILSTTKNVFVKNKLYQKKISKKTNLDQPTKRKSKHEYFQTIFSKFTFLIHFNANLFLYADVDASKQNGINGMIFHVKNHFMENILFKQFNFEPILYFNKCLIMQNTANGQPN